MLDDRIVAAVTQGYSLRSAIEVGLEETVRAANTRLHRGESLSNVLAAEGLAAIPSIRSYVRSGLPRDNALNEEISVTRNVYIVLPGLDLDDIPSSACMEAHLPQGRPPTRDELRRAWEKCRE
jgi:hypothetical protein